MRVKIPLIGATTSIVWCASSGKKVENGKFKFSKDTNEHVAKIYCHHRLTVGTRTMVGLDRWMSLTATDEMPCNLAVLE